MSPTSEPSVCPLCGAALDPAQSSCPQCHAAAEWQDLARAINASIREFEGWRTRAMIDDVPLAKVRQHYGETRAQAAALASQGVPFPPDTGLPSSHCCWRCRTEVMPAYSYCNACGAPLGKGADAVRYSEYLLKETEKSTGFGLTLFQAHACAADVRGHIASLRSDLDRNRLEGQRLAAMRVQNLNQKRTAMRADAAVPPPMVPGEPVYPDERGYTPDPNAPPPLPRQAVTEMPPGAPRRSLLAILLDPHSIQWLLASGGVLLAVGLVIWLASLGVFKNPAVVAVMFGAGTLAVMAAGCAVIKLTRYQIAGRALTLLACLVMPLNLWFYDSHHLITLDGHLWVAALICCVIYAGAAIILADAVFVYVLAGGVAMTGLLMLADLHKLAEIAAPSTMLIVLGLIALHAERAFADDDGPFSRKRFGMACFWSAQALIAAGLLLLLGAQMVGWLSPALPWLQDRPLVMTDPKLRLLALALVAAGVYSYLYSDIIVRRKGIYLYFAAFTLLWAEVLLIDLLHLTYHPSALIAVMALTSLAVNLAYSFTMKRAASEGAPRLTRPVPPLGFLLALLPVLYGISLHLRATRVSFHENWPFAVDWGYVGAIALTAVCCRISAAIAQRRMVHLVSAYFFLTAGATMIAAAGLLSLLGIHAWPQQAPLLILIPIAYLLASRLYKGKPAEEPLFAVAQTATGVMLVSVLFTALHISARVEPIVHMPSNLLLALFCAEAAVFYALAAILYGNGRHIYLAAVMACGALWQSLNYWRVLSEVYIIMFAVLGLALLIGYRLATWERVVRPGLVEAAFRCANALMSMSFVSAVLMGMSRLAIHNTKWPLAILTGSLAIMAVVAAGLAQSGWRRWYITLTVALAAFTFIIVQVQIDLSPWQNIELFCVVAGMILLTVGHLAWYKEQTRQSDTASYCLLFGALLAGIPLAIASMINRFGYHISTFDELALATVSTLMFVSGFLFRLRATTLIGGSLLGVHLIMLLIFAGMQAQLAMGVYLTLGGAVIFGAGVLLSVYRDRLLTLPERIKHREGIFKVLSWR